jgi:hypothetical protein
MITFQLHRTEDKGGVSGTGVVADGCISGKWVVLIWRTQHSSVAVYSSMAELRAIHGHGGSTKVVYDNACPGCGHPIDIHVGDNCGYCEIGLWDNDPDHRKCDCCLMNHPEYTKQEMKWVPAVIIPGKKPKTKKKGK